MTATRVSPGPLEPTESEFFVIHPGASPHSAQVTALARTGSRDSGVQLRAAFPQGSLAALVHEHLDFVWRSLRHLGLRDADCDDACQRVWLVLTQKFEQITPGKERSFIFSVVVRVASETRRSVRHGHSSLDERSMSTGQLSPEQACERDRARDLLQQVLAGMTFEQRAVFVMYELEGLNTKEISEALGVQRGTVASRLRLAREYFERRVARLQRQRDGFRGLGSHATGSDGKREAGRA